MCRQRAGCNAGTLTARSLVEAAARDMQAKGRLQLWSSKADGQRAWWKLPRGTWKVLGVLGVLRV